jgi:hypothetical protein
VRLENPLSLETEVMRTSLVPGLLASRFAIIIGEPAAFGSTNWVALWRQTLTISQPKRSWAIASGNIEEKMFTTKSREAPHF